MTRYQPSALTLPIAIVLVAGVAMAQPGADVAALQAAKTQATATFFDTAQPVAVRVQAIQRMGYPEPETFEKLLAVARTRAEDDQVRLAAMKRYRYDDRYVDTVVSIIADTTESEMLASELIYDIARRTTFRQPAEVRQRLQTALRDRLDDPRDLVRLAAYRSLVPNHDTVAIDRLVDGVRDGTPPIPLADAIELLDVDGPTRHVATVRPFVDHPDPKVQAEAARVLAVDPDNRQAVVALARDPQASREVRLKALRALAREDAEYFSYALRLMSNRGEDPDVRYAAVEGAMARLNYQDVAAEQQVVFAQAVEGIMRNDPDRVTSEGKNLAAEAKRLLAHLRRYFPAVRRHFARR
jgi:hypothetical protein